MPYSDPPPDGGTYAPYADDWRKSLALCLLWLSPFHDLYKRYTTAENALLHLKITKIWQQQQNFLQKFNMGIKKAGFHAEFKLVEVL